MHTRLETKVHIRAAQDRTDAKADKERSPGEGFHVLSDAAYSIHPFRQRKTEGK